jgi:hypothetical protein
VWAKARHWLPIVMGGALLAGWPVGQMALLALLAVTLRPAESLSV